MRPKQIGNYAILFLFEMKETPTSGVLALYKLYLNNFENNAPANPFNNECQKFIFSYFEGEKPDKYLSIEDVLQVFGHIKDTCPPILN